MNGRIEHLEEDKDKEQKPPKKKSSSKPKRKPGESQYQYNIRVKREKKSPTELRDSRIFRNAAPGGIIQREMLKTGYNPNN